MTVLVKICAVAVLLLGLIAPVSAKQMDPTCFLRIPSSVHDRSESVTKENVNTLMRDAEGGNSTAQMTLALLFLDNKVIPEDVDKAVYWAQRAAAQGGPGTKDLLLHASFARNEAKKTAKKEDWTVQMRRWAETGLMYMQYAYAETLKSFGKAKDAAPWYKKAAAQGCMDARTKLSEMYDWKTPANRVQAYKWISLADYATAPNERMKEDLAYDENRVRTAQARIRRHMTRTETNKAEALAARWATKHGETYTRRKWPDEHIFYVSEESLPLEIARSRGYLLVHFTSFDTNCKPCIESNMRIDKLSKRYHTTVAFARLNRVPWWKKSVVLSTKYNVPGLPITVLFRNGKEQRRWVGSKTEGLAHTLDECCSVAAK